MNIIWLMLIIFVIFVFVKVHQWNKKIIDAERNEINSAEERKGHALDERGRVSPETDRKYILAAATDLVNALLGAPDPSRVMGLEYEQWYDNQRREALIKAFPSQDKVERDEHETKKQNNNIV